MLPMPMTQSLPTGYTRYLIAYLREVHFLLIRMSPSLDQVLVGECRKLSQRHVGLLQDIGLCKVKDFLTKLLRKVNKRSGEGSPTEWKSTLCAIIRIGQKHYTAPLGHTFVCNEL